MGTIRASIMINDGMSSAFKSMNKALNTVLGGFESLQNLSSSTVDTRSIKIAKYELSKAELTLSNVEKHIKDANVQQKKFNKKLHEGGKFAETLGNKIKTVIGAYLGLLTVKSVGDFIKDGLASVNVNNNVERQLQVVLANANKSGIDVEINPIINPNKAQQAFNDIKDKAGELSKTTLYDSTALVGGAAELATYIKDKDAISKMMETLTDFATGMSGGGEVNTEQMVQYANQLGKALGGTYDGLTKKGFTLTDVQKNIIENGTDMEKALVIGKVIGDDWGGIAEAMLNTPEGKLIKFKQNWDNIKAVVAEKLYPSIMLFFNTIERNFPQIETIALGFAGALSNIIVIFTAITTVASTLFKFIVDNWIVISPIIWGIVSAFIAYYTALAVYNNYKLISNRIMAASIALEKLHNTVKEQGIKATIKATLAQWSLNAAFLACPIFWVVFGIIAIIAAIYGVVYAINKFKDKSISATGIIAGAFMWLGALIGNIIIGLLNSLIQYLWTIFIEPSISGLEWWLNVCNGGFNSFGDAVKNLIGNIISWFLSLGKVVTKIIDAMFGSDWSSQLNQLQNTVLSWGKNENAITLDIGSWEIEHRFDMKNAYTKGYDFGENLENKIADKFKFAQDDDPLKYLNNGADNLEDISSNTADTAGSASRMANSMDIAEDELKYLRDIAERETINRFTKAEITVEINNENHINSGMDLDGVISYLNEGITEVMEIAAEGEHE